MPGTTPSSTSSGEPNASANPQVIAPTTPASEATPTRVTLISVISIPRWTTRPATLAIAPAVPSSGRRRPDAVDGDHPGRLAHPPRVAVGRERQND